MERQVLNNKQVASGLLHVYLTVNTNNVSINLKLFVETCMTTASLQLKQKVPNSISVKAITSSSSKTPSHKPHGAW